MPSDDAIALGWTGVTLRSTGVRYDVRKTHPYMTYDGYEFEVPIGTTGDNYDRFMCRQEEIRQSAGIIEQALEAMADDGPINIDDPRIVLPLTLSRVRIHHEPKSATLEIEVKAKHHVLQLSFPDRHNRWRSALQLAITERPPNYTSCLALFSLAAWRRDMRRPWKGAELQRRERKGQAQAAPT